MDFFTLFGNTIFVSVFSISVGMSFVTLATFAITRMHFGSGKLQNAVYNYFMAGMIIPTFVLIFPIYMMDAKLGLLNTLWGVILPYWGWTAPLNALIVAGSFRGIPSTLDEAAAIDGCGSFGILTKVLLPLLKPALITCLIICFLGCWNEFTLSSIVLTSSTKLTISLAVSKFKGMYNSDYATMAAGIIILTVPQIAFFSIFQRYIVDGMVAGAVKG